MQTDDGLESYVKGRINPFIDEHDCLLTRGAARGRSTTACTSSASAA
jgi:hypothetical protein